MKKIIRILILMSLSIILVSCSSNKEKEVTKKIKETEAIVETEVEEETEDSKNYDDYEMTTYVGEANGVYSEFTFYHEGDKVLKQTARNVMDYAKMGFPNAEALKKEISPSAEKYQGIKGITQRIEYGDTEAVEYLDVDYTELDFDSAKSIPGMVINGDAKNGGVSLEKSVALFEEKGYTKQ